jgi:hypothetical protein
MHLLLYILACYTYGYVLPIALEIGGKKWGGRMHRPK